MRFTPPAPTRWGSLFTLIEATVVITILALMAALVVPNVVALQRSRAVQGLKASLLRLPAEAQNEARRSKQAVTLRTEGSTTLVLEQLGQDGQEATEFKRLSLGNEIQLDAAQLEGESVDLASWEWTVYPDGSARVGRLEFLEGNRVLSLLLPSEGELPRWSAAGTLEAGEGRWSAGELEQRG
ncbi:Tfp pilus assembly protein FimT/FimU [Armatimonas sp.]|uniref:pilus assembly FimT family protein n=1 Tax=Armatimonas sp. TaxID=1872638 RepID=UPI0037535524